MRHDLDPWSASPALPLRRRAGDLFDETYDSPCAGSEPYDDDPAPGSLDRLTHLVFLDGRLLDAWTEPARGTRWAGDAARLDRQERGEREGRPAFQPLPPPYTQVLDWLAAVCGGPAAVAALDEAPLTDDHIDLPADLPDLRSRHRLESVAELLDSVCAALFDAETSFAARIALLALWSEAPEVVLGAPSAAHVAGGVVWAVGKANGLFGPRGRCTQASVQEALALSAAISGQGRRVAAALRGLRTTASRPWVGQDIPDLEQLGRTDVLTAATRGRLVRLRDRAVRDRESAERPVPQDSRNPSATSSRATGT